MRDEDKFIARLVCVPVMLFGVAMLVWAVVFLAGK
jgi:hypothetical protein